MPRLAYEVSGRAIMCTTGAGIGKEQVVCFFCNAFNVGHADWNSDCSDNSYERSGKRRSNSSPHVPRVEPSLLFR